MKISWKQGSAIAIVLAVALYLACTSNKPTSNRIIKNDFGTTLIPSNISSDSTVFQDTSAAPIIESMGGVIQADFPFNENPSLWRGADGQRTGGGTVHACGGNINSHSGADYYARDLSRIDGTQQGKAIYSVYPGYVIRYTWDGAYGISLVTWNPSNRVAMRYSHMNDDCRQWVTVGQWIGSRIRVGSVGNTGTGGGTPHLHLVAYENVPQGLVPYVCLSDYYCCRMNAWR